MLLDKQKRFLYDKITNSKEVLNMKTVKQMQQNIIRYGRMGRCMCTPFGCC